MLPSSGDHMGMKPFVVNPSPQQGPLLEVLDHCNRPVGVMSQGLVHSQKLRHHRAAALIYWPETALLLSRRSALCPDSPLCWDVTFSEHVAAGEAGYDTVRRGLHSRLGLSISKLRLLRIWEACALTGNETLTVYSATLRCAPWARDESGLDEIMLLDSQEVRALVDNFPRQVSSTLRFLSKHGEIFG